MNKIKTNYKQCTIATLSLWAIYLLVIVIGVSISEYIEAQDYHRAVDLIHMNWISNLASLSIPFIPSLIIFFILVHYSFSKKTLIFTTAGVFIVAYNITLKIWLKQDGMQDDQSFVGMMIVSVIVFSLVSSYSWIALKIIKYQSK